ncbi:MAG: efflux transporter outer membrane subunit [Acidobacteria bacterium]|nr:efflux transporter outer membrane subunit [Acidobacteriota bacterium]
MKKQILLLAIAAIFSGSCTLAPQYTRPKAPIPEQLPQAKPAGTSAKAKISANPATMEWGKFFPDKKLRKIIEMALNNNRDLRIAALNVEKAKAVYGIRRAELYPTVTATGGEIKQRISSGLLSPGESAKIREYNVNLGISSWEIDFFGRIRSMKAEALQTYLGTEEARRSAQISLISAVAQTFLTLAADRENLKLLESTLSTQKTSCELIRKSYKLGIAGESELEQAKAGINTVKLQIANIKQLLAEDQNALNLLAGKPVPESLLPENLNTIQPPEDISPGLSSEVLLRRPDILMAESALKRENAAIGAARAALFPRISLTTALGRASRELSNLFKGGNRTWNFIPQIEMPIFDARSWSALKASKANRKIALARYEKAIQAAFREVADTLAAQNAAEKQMAAQQAIVQSTVKILKLSNARYNYGIDSYLNVLKTQRTLYVEKQNLLTLRLNKLINKVRLYAVLGGGGGNAP